MKLFFEANLDFQQEAIKSITDLFAGQSAVNTGYMLHSQNIVDSNLGAISNRLLLSDEQILKNLQKVQQRNGIEVSTELEDLNFTVEMETGTGKTYVYLRTIYELNKQYGFKKFVVVVPSVAIREGVLKSLQITHEHFQNLYDNEPINFQVYSKPSLLRGFATTDVIEVLVINIDAFAKDENVINRPNDRLSGYKPIEFIQQTKPIVIIDEPQNMETEKRVQAINNLQGLCHLRYSATHRTRFNLTYRLNPVKAYDLGLVKQIEVDSVYESNAFNDAFVSLDSVKATKTKVTAKVVITCNDASGAKNSGVKNKKLTVKVGDDLYQLSNQREVYADGYIVDEISASDNFIQLSNGKLLYQGDSQGGLSDEMMKFQIERTIEEHLNKELRLFNTGIKVLSLFFIDRVANYRKYDDVGNKMLGKFGLWFEEIYKVYINKPKFKCLDRFAVEDSHNGYFSQDKKGCVKDTTGVTKADDGTYSLIMKDKERLLDVDNSLRFIFSHSALREGWDNPNVFQICTLNETKSEIKKRQEIGRGLRLSVNGDGQRIYDKEINRLTVIANDSYEDFAKQLQQEIEEDSGVCFEGRVKNKKHRTKITYRKGFDVDPKFLEIWAKLKHKTLYRVNYTTSKLIEVSAKALQELPEIKAPSIRATKVKITIDEAGVDTNFIAEKQAVYNANTWQIPDILGYIQDKTELTRSTIEQIISQSGRVADILINPQLFLDLAVTEIKRVLHQQMIEGIKYQQLGDSIYEMSKFEASELEIYLNKYSFKVSDSSKTIYDNFVPLDSKVESKFAKDCETSEIVSFYFKLPNWFKIPTPIGNYNPDWAVVLENDSKIYFVAETKDTGTDVVDINKLRLDEQLKIKCGDSHFAVFDDLNFKVVNKVAQLIE